MCSMAPMPPDLLSTQDHIRERACTQGLLRLDLHWKTGPVCGIMLSEIIDRRIGGMIYDITQPLFGCSVYPGDARPARELVSSMERGDLYNLTNISLCVHNGTHVDAPVHFIPGGKGIDQIALEKFIGPAYVAQHNGPVTSEDARAILRRAGTENPEARHKILIKGDATVTLEAARVFAAAGIDLIGNESQSVGPEDSPMAVHLELLQAEVMLLEGVRLANVPEGVYYLNCAPLNLEGADGAPCRAVLVEMA